MKILLLSPNQIHRYNWSHQLFRNEIGRQHETMYYGEGYPNYVPDKPITEVIKNKSFDLILTYGLKYTEPFIGIGEITNIPKAHIVIDYFPDATSGTYERNHKLFERDKYDIYLGIVGNIIKNLEENNICKKAYLLPFSIDTNIYKKTKEYNKKNIDVFSVFTVRNDTYPNREKIHNLIKSLNDLRIFIKRIQHEDYIDKINSSKICITSNNKFKSLSIKYYEILACGSFLLADEPEDLLELGFIPDKHLVLYNDLNDLKDKIYFYLSNSKIIRTISNQGMEFVRENHNNSIRVKQFTKIIKELI
jgi:spore maturation protein CgeB